MVWLVFECRSVVICQSRYKQSCSPSYSQRQAPCSHTRSKNVLVT
uniref:Uncharacterized protein n=1 Tax=Myoviridae sp. ctdv95 TaxID=2825143 RepID=A0A8S5QBI6_9CAUD|nr:MAG TPA: hypothetical protein [Myoviridae sp. ctdv95]DAR31739.1 MAG TPA: hypothetical protein [Caudoviricetes sp.]DAX56146.1 MAG TPA: hypothetical protein [Caudoviricetes sp.]